jgi:hypothetical protein
MYRRVNVTLPEETIRLIIVAAVTSQFEEPLYPTEVLVKAPEGGSGVAKHVYKGNLNQSRICTSIVERNNLTIRTFQRRFNPLALTFRRKLEGKQEAMDSG